MQDDKEPKEEMANPKGNPQNLKPWKPGESGNPGGRPKKTPITDSYEKMARKRLPEDLRIMLKLPKGAKYADAVSAAQYRSAIKGKTDAARELRESIEGKTTQRLELTGAEGRPIQHLTLDFKKLNVEEMEVLNGLLLKAQPDSVIAKEGSD
jgi:hypothetical protein